MLKEIHKQPEHIRKIFMWTMVVITFSVIGYIGLKSNVDKFIALVNPSKTENQDTNNIAKEDKKNKSPFALISSSFSSLTDSVSDLFGKKKENIQTEIRNPSNNDVSPKQFPLE